jgi:hypothetical protein
MHNKIIVKFGTRAVCIKEIQPEVNDAFAKTSYLAKPKTFSKDH